MATSFWTRCNPNISIETTTKKFFGRFLYKLVVYAPGSRSVDSKYGIDRDLERRKEMYNDQGTHRYSWWYRRNDTVNQAIADQLYKIKELKDNRTNLNILVRIEEPRIQIYSESIEQLEQIVNEYFKDYKSSVEAISEPASVESTELLNSGAILTKKSNGYRYKVIVRDGKYTIDTKLQILNYLESLDDLVKLPHSMYLMMRKESGYIWNCYFYTNDTGIISFLSLISPNLVSNIHELVAEADK